MKITTKMYLASILFTMTSLLCMAQAAPPPEGPGGGPPPPPGLPIDDPVLIVLVLGLFYGALKMIKLKRS